jgi:hypothetical protein
MIHNDHLPEWFSCTIDIKNLSVVEAWLTEHIKTKNPIHIIKTATSAFVYFNDDGLAALFKLAHGDMMIPET